FRRPFRAGMEVFDDGARDREAVIGAGAAADLIEKHERAPGGVAQDGRRLEHLDHKRRLAPADVVLSADAGEDAVDDADRRAGGLDTVLELFEARRDEALGADKRLSALVVGRYEGEIGLAYFEVVAKDAVVSNAQRSNAGALTLLRFEPSDSGTDVATE